MPGKAYVRVTRTKTKTKEPTTVEWDRPHRIGY